MRKSSEIPIVDCVVLSRDDVALHAEVAAGIAAQRGVRLVVHRVFGRRANSDAGRLPAIVRARNEGKRRGNSQLLLFLDDDVVLTPDCVRLLLDGLRTRPDFAALAADYLNQSGGRINCEHVAMGATLFRRSALDQIQFRWADNKCECLCCCSDLRRKRWGIGYLSQAQARHIAIAPPSPSANESPATAASVSPAGETGPAFVLAAFDRRHYLKFRLRFLSSLRKAGNYERVLAFAYGLYTSERRQLERLPGVELISLRSNRVAVPIRRLLDFQRPIERLPPGSMVAYWDAGDVIFQDRLDELWRLVRANPDKLLVAAEPFGHPENTAVAEWTLSIGNPQARKWAFDLLAPRPFLNGGFAAGTASIMLQYLQGANELLHSVALRGTADWGDQTAMNLYCHSDPNRFLAVEDRWNYCLCGRRRGEVHLLSEGRFVRTSGGTISAVHGNGRAFNPYALWAPNALARCAASNRFVA